MKKIKYFKVEVTNYAFPANIGVEKCYERFEDAENVCKAAIKHVLENAKEHREVINRFEGQEPWGDSVTQITFRGIESHDKGFVDVIRFVVKKKELTIY